MTWYTAAADERFQVAAPVCSTWSVEHHVKLDAVQENCDCIYFMNTFLRDLPAVGALIAPRPLKMPRRGNLWVMASVSGPSR